MYDRAVKGWDAGYWTVGRLRGIPIRLHLTIPIGALLFSGVRFAPIAWCAIFFLILFHELGHAVVMRASGQTVLRIDLHGLGGLCVGRGEVTAFQRAAIAWGGVWAQMVLLAITLLFFAVAGGPTSPTGAELYDVFVRVNIIIMALNLIPFPPLDGAEAWPLIPMLRDRWRQERLVRQVAKEERQESLRIEKDVSLEVEQLEHLDDEIDEKTAKEANDLLARINEDIRKDRKNRSS